MKGKIIEAIKNDSLVLFVGAGMSMPLNYPSWDDLIQNILKEIQEDHAFNFTFYIDQGKNIDVFKVLDELEHHNLVSKVRNELYNQITSIEFVDSKLLSHKKLWKLSEKIITTNYDKVLEEVKPRNVDVFSNGNAFQQSKSIKGSPFLYKIHGDITDPDSCILFNSDYKRLYEEDTSDLNTLKSFLLNKTILFIGFSLNDPYVNKQMGYLTGIYKGHNQEHYVLQTKRESFDEFNVKSIVIEDWFGAFDKFLDELIKIKKETTTSLTVVAADDKVDINTIKDVLLLEKMLAEKKESFENSEDIKKKAISKEMHSISDRMIELHTQKINLNFLENIPEHQQGELEHVFDTIFQSETLSKQTLQKIDKVRDLNSSSYQWYQRSVIVSSLACSIINHKKIDPKKIDLLIDFTNDSEDKVWQKAITYLFLVLNQLGNKWLKFTKVKTKLERLKSNIEIQNALNTIITSVQLEVQNVSPINGKVFENNYFKNNPFNYFLPFYDNNPSIDKIYDDENITNIDKYLSFLKDAPFPDSFKYLICNSKRTKNDGSLKPSTDEKEYIDYIFSIHHSFEPYLNYINEILNFYENYHDIDKVLNQKTSVIGFKNLKSHLLSTVETHRAMGRQFILEKKFSQAIIHYNKILELNSDDIGALSNKAECFGKIKKETNEILSLRFRIEKIDPKNHDNLDDISFLLRKKKKYKKAIEYSNRAIELNCKINYYYHSRGKSKSKLKDFKGAIEDFKIALNLKVNHDIYYDLADAQYYLEQYIEALKNIDYSIKENDKDPTCFVLKANILRRLNMIPESFDIIDNVIEKNKKDSVAHGTKAAIYSTIEKYDEFYLWLEKALDLGAKASWLHTDVLDKHQHENRFKQLLIKYDQTLV